MYHPFPQDREEQTTWARSLLARNDWVVLDTETTGLDEKAEVVQVAVLAPDGAELLNSLVRPVGEISPGAQAVHGLTRDILQDAPAFAELSPTLQTILSGKEVIVYNMAYDFRILWQSCFAAGISPVWLHGSQWTCAMERYAAWHGEWNDHRGSYRWQKLPAGDHSAAGDCRVTLDWTPGDDEAVYDDGQVSTTANWRVFQELTGRYRAAITNALVQSGACPAEEAWAAIFYLGSSDAEVSHCLLLNLAERTIYSDELGPGLQYVTGALAHSRHGAG